MKQTYKLIFIALILLGLCVSGVQAILYTDHYPPAQSNTYVVATSALSGGSYQQYYMTDPSKSLVGSYAGNSWISSDTNGYHQRFNIDYGPSNETIMKQIYYENLHNSGAATGVGAKTFSLWATNTSSEFTNVTYGQYPATWTKLATSQGFFDQHVALNQADPKYITITNSVAYRYYSVQTEDNWGTDTHLGLRRFVLQSETQTIPTVSFTASPTTGVNPLTVTFNDTTTSISAITSYNVSFGDDSWWNETTFPATNITHLYSTAGNYTVDWYVTNAEGTGSASTTITVWGAVHSAFSMFNAAGTAPHTTYLYDTSTNLTPGPVTYLTDFGDGNTSTEANTYYTWNITGEYNVTHTVSNGLSSETSFTTVTVGTPTPPVVAPVASFYGGPQLGAPPLQVFFTDVSTNTPTGWNWSHGDGTYSIIQNPTHWYNKSGFYTVSLTASNGAGSNTSTQTNYVMVY